MNGFLGREARRQLVPPWSISRSNPADSLCFSSRLPSCDEGLWFDADYEMSVEITTRDESRRRRVLSEVRIEVLSLSRAQTQRHTVADVGQAEAELSQRLLARGLFDASGAQAVSISVDLSASSDDIELVKRRERFLPQSEIEAEEHSAQMRRLQRLTDDVFTDPGVARRWWYDQNSDRIHELEAAAGGLDLMMAKDSSTQDQAAMSDSAGSLVDILLCEISDADRSAVLERLALLLESYGRGDLSDQLRKGRSEEQAGGG